MPDNYSRKINCDFFRMNVGPDQRGDFVQTLDGFCSRCPRTRDRDLEVEDGFLRLHDWRVEDGNARGALLELRTDGGARIANLDNYDLRDLELRQGEGLADYSCFRYFGEFKTLVIYRNRNAGNEKSLRYYLEQKTNVRPIDFDVLIATDALQRFERMQEIVFAELTIAMPNNLNAETAGRGFSVGQEESLLNRARAATIKTQLSMGHTRRSMDLNTVKGWIKGNIDDYGEAVHSAKVRGRLESGEPIDSIDLIQDRIRQEVEVRAVGSRPAISDFYDALERAYHLRRDGISRQFLPESA